MNISLNNEITTPNERPEVVIPEEQPLPDDEPDFTDTIVARDLWFAFWIIIALVAVNVAQVGNQIVKSWQPPPPEHILEVKCHGEDCEPVGVVEPITAIRNIPNGLLHGQLENFVHDAFSIDRDPDEELRMWNNTQDRVTGLAFTKLDAWYHRDGDHQDPRILGHYLSATAQPSDIEKLEGDRYLVNYQLTTRQSIDTVSSVTKWRVVLHVIVGRTKKVEDAGWFVNDLEIPQEVKE